MARIEDHHAEWLSLVETSGSFLTVPALKRALPDGLSAVPLELADLRVAYTEWLEDPSLQQRWIRWVLDELLGLGPATSDAAHNDPTHRVAEHGVTLSPSFVVRDVTQDGDPAVLLVHSVDPGIAIDRTLPGAWAASPIDRAVELAKASRISLALVTNGQRWTLVWAREGETTGKCTWRSEVWLEEPLTLRAFVELLGSRRFFALPVEQGLAQLLTASASKQQEVADQLGAQVRRATELLIATLDREDRDRHGALLEELDGAEVYQGATTVMMRLVFLFVAEERRLLPIDDERYAATLAASTLRSQLQERADRDGEDVLERSQAAWHRVLALFRAVHAGIEHDALRLPAYGGGLFDPDRYPFLEGRSPDTTWHIGAAEPLPVDDRTMLHLLDQLQTLEQSGARVLLSYQALDVEQIGHVYEGLLDHTAVRISDIGLGLNGKLEPEIQLGNIEGWAADGEDALVKRLAKETGRSAKAIAKALAAEPSDEALARLRAACLNDDAVLARATRYHALLRTDLRGDPLVFPAGSLYVTQAIDRRASGAYYTPRQLAEEVVQHALDPVVYDPGPVEEADASRWQLRSAQDLLDLKVADIAMGSGAFLVASCRYLAARLLEAWTELGDGEWTVFGRSRAEAADEPAVPADPERREQLAHRLVTERCLYGVDKNPMAVEMAKLSLWLITLAKDQPFSFVDHALRCGDSLLGVTDLDQLRVAHLDPKWPRQASLDLGFGEIEASVDRALQLREDLEDFVVHEIADAERKASLLVDADAALDDARLLADLVVGAALSQQPDADPLHAAAGYVRTMLDPAAPDDDRLHARSELHRLSEDWLVERRGAVGEVEAVTWADRHPFHWGLEYPEVRQRGGFDAIVGNPPFQGGKKISGALGGQYRDYLVTWLAGGVRGSADLVAYFYLRATQLVRTDSSFGLIATNTLAQGDTREVGLDQLGENGMTIYRANSSAPWPGGASLEVATVWARRGAWERNAMLDGASVSAITSALTQRGRVVGNAQRLDANRDLSFQGTVVVGMGFVLSPEEAETMLAVDSCNADVVRPYLIGEDLNSSPDGSPSRWVIDFRDWPKERAAEYATPFARVEMLVRPERAKVNRQAHRERWWQFGDKRPALYRAIAPLDRCIAVTQVSTLMQPMLVPTEIVLDQQVVVIAYNDYEHFGLLASSFHWTWAVTYGSTQGLTARYTHTNCFETFVQPDVTEDVARLGGELHDHRGALMLDRQEGLTKTYSRVHDPDELAADIAHLREIHVALDHAVRDAYGWHDLDLDHDFHDTKFGMRFTFAPVPRQEVLDRLLELNHERYAEEVRHGLHDKAKTKRKAKLTPAGAMTLEFDDA